MRPGMARLEVWCRRADLRLLALGARHADRLKPPLAGHSTPGGPHVIEELAAGAMQL